MLTNERELCGVWAAYRIQVCAKAILTMRLGVFWRSRAHRLSRAKLRH
jgi:hypothetical protein